MCVSVLAVLGLLALGWWHVVDLRRNLYRSLVGEVRALEQARSSGYQKEAWKLLRQALELDPRRKAELRQEAVACLGDFAGLEPTHWDLETDLHALALHPNGTLLALGLDDGTVRLRDLVTGQDLASQGANPLPGTSVMVTFFCERLEAARKASTSDCAICVRPTTAMVCPLPSKPEA